jgi:hypothetical protein
VLISKTGCCGCIRWMRRNVQGGMSNCLGDNSVLPFITPWRFARLCHPTRWLTTCYSGSSWHRDSQKNMYHVYIVLCMTFCPFSHLLQESLNVILWRGLPLLGKMRNLRQDVSCSHWGIRKRHTGSLTVKLVCVWIGVSRVNTQTYTSNMLPGVPA